MTANNFFRTTLIRRRLLASVVSSATAERSHGLLGEEGAGLVETALAISVFLMILFAVFDFSLAFYTYHYISDAAREGSRYAIVRGNMCKTYSNTAPCPAAATDIASYVEDLGFPGIDPSQMTIDVGTCDASKTNPTTWTTCDNSGMTYNAPGDQVSVKVSYPFALSVPFWKAETLTIASTSSMVISQ